jgi:hypothetical protein
MELRQLFLAVFSQKESAISVMREYPSERQ